MGSIPDGVMIFFRLKNRPRVIDGETIKVYYSFKFHPLFLKVWFIDSVNVSHITPARAIHCCQTRPMTGNDVDQRLFYMYTSIPIKEFFFLYVNSTLYAGARWTTQ